MPQEATTQAAVRFMRGASGLEKIVFAGLPPGGCTHA